jgi:ribosome-associated protein
MRIPINSGISIDEGELSFAFVRSSGPGGQNVNKVSTAVQLRFDASGSPSLPREVKDRLIPLAGSRATAGGMIIIEASRFRSQKQNRDDAVARLIELVRRAAAKPKTRRKSSPTRTARQRRLTSKRRRGEIKKLRSRLPDD